ncbi:MAG: hypothetical protein ACTHLW_21540, partial [Verrucomicrobiota bacterium]
MSTSVIKKEEVLALDTIANSALSTLGISGAFEQTFAMAEAMMQLRAAITPAMMDRFMKLQNTKLGFMTDKNPRVWNKKENAYNKPYGEEVVKDCIIEATLRGVKTVGNQFNIISGNCYITLEGFQFKLRQLKGLTEFKPSFGVPRISPGGALVECEATWCFQGVPDSMKATIACKGDDYAGSDSYIGKAQRKFLKRIYERVTGTSEPDGEADTEAAQISAAAPAARSEAAPTFSGSSAGGEIKNEKPAMASHADPEKTPPAVSPSTDEAAEAAAGLAPSAPTAKREAKPMASPQAALQAFME